MTKVDWLTGTGPQGQSVFDFLDANASRRKVLLFAAADRTLERFFGPDGSWVRFMQIPKLRQVMKLALDAIEATADGRLDDLERDAVYATRISFMSEMTDVEVCDFQDWFEPLQDWKLAKYRAVAECAHGPLTIRHEIFGNPLRPVGVEPAWLSTNVLRLANAIYDSRGFDWLPMLADALLDSGCNCDEILSHCREPGPHFRGCWALDLVLSKG